MAVTVALAIVLSLVFAIAGPVAASPGWSVAGTWNINVVYQSVPYPETLVLTQTGNTITGVSVNSVPPVPASAFTITGGFTGDSLTFKTYYDPNSSETTTFSGTIASDGSMSGTWADNPGFLGRSGTWASTSGKATYTSNIAGSIMVTGNITAATVSLAYPGPTRFDHRQHSIWDVYRRQESWHRFGTPPGTDYGTVTVVNNSDPNPTWTLSAFSEQ